MKLDGNFVTDEMDVKKVWREQFKNLHNISSNEEMKANMCVIDDARRKFFLEMK